MIVNDKAYRMGKTFSDVAAAVGITPVTLRKKCSRPDLFTGAELKRIAQALKLTDTEKNEILTEVME